MTALPFPDDIDWRSGPPLPAERPRTLAALLHTCHETHGNHIVLHDRGRDWSWSSLLNAAQSLADSWAPSIHPNDHVMIALPNSAAFCIAEFACWMCGAVSCPIPAQLSSAHIQVYQELLTPALYLSQEEEVLLPRPTTYHNTWTPQQTDAAALILCTSGSSGTPRAVQLSQDNICSQQAAFALLWPEVGPNDRLCSYLPWFHSFGSLAERLWALCRGASLFLIPEHGHNHQLFIATLKQQRPSVFMSVPKMHTLVCEHQAIQADHIRWVFTAGAALGQQEEHWYAQQNIPVYEGWGLTETSPSATITLKRTHNEVGQPIPGVSVGIHKENQHIFIYGPNVMLGYLHHKALPIHNNTYRYLDSGDLGHWSDGGLQLTGRADHMLKLANGEKVPAPAIESQLENNDNITHAILVVDHGLHVIIDSTATDAEIRSCIQSYNHQQQIPYHCITHIFRLPAPASIENGLLTPSHKIARTAVLKQCALGILHTIS